jgi:hypothetical protein
MQKTVRKRKKSLVFEVELERYITAEDRGLVASLPLKHAGGSVGRRLNPMRLAEIRKCSECKFKPVVLLTKKQIPCCAVHWVKLADAQIGWSEEE